MKEKIEKFIGLSRRQFVMRLSALMAIISGWRGAAAAPTQQAKAAQGKSTLTADDFKPFEEIARRKGVPIHTAEFTEKITSDKIHLDMDMVEQSIRSAITQTQRTGQKRIQGKLEHLLANGTDAQKVEFVLGSGTYYFPEDIENLAKLSRASGGRELAVDCHRVCETVWYYICRCTGSAQQCRDEARELCHIICDPHAG
jgi:hypothetical protein